MSLQDEIMGLEKQFWDSMKGKDPDTAARLTAEACIVAGSSGVAVIDPATMGQMLTGATWELESYSFEDVQMQALDSATVLVGYKVTEQLKVEGEPVRLTAFDTSVWRRETGRWACALHTESLAGDPFGRDKGQATP